MTNASVSTALYRDHHANVGQLAGRIEALLASRSVESDPAALIATVRELFGIFAVHLSLEDSALYPRLLTHPDAGVRATAARFQTEMGNLRARFDLYRTRWPGPVAVAKDPAAFVRETRDVVAALKHRIGREDRELYDLIDRAGMASAA
ncbi:hemerythrin domain-containing protein [Azospirillum sp. YIM B02556]|uniref:Hemerythrin domain-containing protein n=1 Tax=Azospirillum endophyticum TaxID=2800326 RepID=A0ABS1F6X2_9PROT|nr:hemerythrin domain-containing protein [Azospirillum endophyticum]MBK1839181.1 hemerythrin domain-containing protein [Azospirillum endophyticum]